LVIRTEWSTRAIWLRRKFTLPADSLKEPHLRMHRDEDAEVYVNGVLAAKVIGFTTE
jgi:hypothetical protein